MLISVDCAATATVLLTMLIWVDCVATWAQIEANDPCCCQGPWLGQWSYAAWGHVDVHSSSYHWRPCEYLWSVLKPCLWPYIRLLTGTILVTLSHFAQETMTRSWAYITTDGYDGSHGCFVAQVCVGVYGLYWHLRSWIYCCQRQFRILWSMSLLTVKDKEHTSAVWVCRLTVEKEGHSRLLWQYLQPPHSTLKRKVTA